MLLKEFRQKKLMQFKNKLNLLSEIKDKPLFYNAMKELDDAYKLFIRSTEIEEKITFNLSEAVVVDENIFIKKIKADDSTFLVSKATNKILYSNKLNKKYANKDLEEGLKILAAFQNKETCDLCCNKTNGNFEQVDEILEMDNFILVGHGSCLKMI